MGNTTHLEGDVFSFGARAEPSPPCLGVLLVGVVLLIKNGVLLQFRETDPPASVVLTVNCRGLVGMEWVDQFCFSTNRHASGGMDVLDRGGDGELEPCQKPPSAKVRGRRAYAGARVPINKDRWSRILTEVEYSRVLHYCREKGGRREEGGGRREGGRWGRRGLVGASILITQTT